MKFHIFGAGATTGVDRTITIDATSEEEAYELANECGVFPCDLTALPENENSEVPTWVRKTKEQQERDERQFFTVVYGGLAIVICLTLTTSLRWLASDSPSSIDSTRPYTSSSSSTPSSSPMFYPEGGSRDWRNVDDIQTRDLIGYKIPTDPVLQEQYFKDMEAENEREWQELVREGVVTEDD